MTERYAHHTYGVFANLAFPHHYGGNGIETIDLESAERLHTEHFPADQSDHRTFAFEASGKIDPLVQELTLPAI